MSDRPQRGADLVIRTLAGAGVTRIFTLSGNHIMCLFDACLDARIGLVHVRHEAAAVHMADAWGQLRDEPGVAMVTGGPGHLNAISALYTARESDSPMVLLSGHAPRATATRGAFQEVAQANAALPASKAAWTADRADALGDDIARALRLSRSGNTGPVHVSLPVDLLEATTDAPVPGSAAFEEYAPPLDPDDASVLEALLGGARKPIAVVGPQGMRRAVWPRLRAAGERIGLPVVGQESPRGVNDPSLGAFAEVLAEADLLVLVGKSLDFTLGFGRAPAVEAHCRVADLSPGAHDRDRTHRALGGGARLAFSTGAAPGAVAGALEAMAPLTDRGWANAVREAVTHRPVAWQAITSAPGDGVHPVEVARAVARVLDAAEQPLLVCDGGEYGQWMQACLAAPERLLNGPAGAIGCALPYAIGARCARPDATVVACLGDGTFGFHMAEIDTAVRADLPFVAVVGNDARWNAEHQIQLRSFGPERAFGCELLPTRYDAVARAMGAHGEHVDRAADLDAALERAIASRRPAVIDVALDGQAAPVVRRT